MKQRWRTYKTEYVFINKNNSPQGVDSFKILNNVDQILPDITLADPLPILSDAQTSDTKNKQSLLDLPLLLNVIQTSNTNDKMVISTLIKLVSGIFPFVEGWIKCSKTLMNEICEVRNRINQIKARPDVHNEHVRDSKQL